MPVRGIRGATTVRQNDADEILQATTTMLQHIIAQNNVQPEDIASVWITMTEDLNATFPARAIRAMPGWELVPLMCAIEIPVQGSLPLCIRLMVTVNTDKAQRDIRHVYLNEAISLRPDLASS
ncbi:chorismate mutase [Paenibacillus apiarius]|uniref:chorismate mutase n=1 Tax=Paenibacillus apiarius TaxID=46240 RepID=A0ABT4DS62_9BACL|nr:chorismate mutase [Paenibacillus apiarius]MCY9517108.1 chorismate mutase [Paenibacillus apiarius]MCY9520195.1 chorismate mutase [Paenibacillus apiarius]MCY9554917.1 chorismate mutase [Paenibacillus apiarius]MCY9561428.1 chorismate mutase [Paenibacillus apiarius]MCY9685950.1 chorismate mutase [Paenibacillus apiarius]